MSDTIPLDPNLDAEIERLVIQLSRLAAGWRGAIEYPERRELYVSQYHAVLTQLYDLGWDDVLNIDSELPDRLMPAEYLRRTGPKHYPGADAWGDPTAYYQRLLSSSHPNEHHPLDESNIEHRD